MSELEKKDGEPKKKLFNFVMSNPPYQEDKRKDSDNANFAAPVYHEYMDAVYGVSEVTEMITPARFLFNAGATPKKWNEQRLNDEHFKVLKYESDSKKVFPNVGIAGGTAVTIRDERKDYGKIDVFVTIPILNAIVSKVTSNPSFIPFSSISFAPESYKFTDVLYEDHPEIKTLTKTNKKGKIVPLLSDGHAFDLKSNVFESLNQIVFFESPSSVGSTPIKIEGVSHGKRKSMYIDRKYIKNERNIDNWKVLLAKAAGTGELGATLSAPIVAPPSTGHTQTFMSFGSFNFEEEAIACSKYIKSKFARTLLGILKITQDNPSSVWRLIPLQDFTVQSDIDWTKPIPEIDKQLYAKYGLDENEIEFIEKHIKPMG